ncbi:unnamed protein product, partial [Gongylonema pulchrum]|uniref:IG domain-containing protein n=1 Tax=Gongylonema pulchrum TaxID=637853 RepID=A0A183DGZ7_9BILA
IEVEGKPKEVKWLKAGSPVDAKVAKANDLGDGKYQLVIDDINENDIGEYAVQLQIIRIFSALEVLKLKKGLEDKEVQIGTKLRLYVEAEGQPKVVKWFHGKDEIKSNRRVKIEQAAQEYSLEVEEAEKSDEGPYRVVLSTETETIESSCTVTVTEGQVTPTFKKGLQDQSVPKGS